MRTIFHIDMDSFFATIEQQARPYLRGRPIVVSGKEGSRSVIVASSVEAKKLGIKTGMLPFEARARCKTLIFVEPDGLKYENASRKMIEIFKQYTENVEVFSIDEAFLDMTGYCKNAEQASCSAKRIKAQIKAELGEWVTCSVGIAKNKLLAKLASGLGKPDGLFFINDQNREAILSDIELDDFCGIGRRIKKRLEALGVDTVLKLREYPKAKLIEFFGPFYGEKLHNMSWGEDDEPVTSYLQQSEAKSVGRSYTLAKNTFDKTEILTVLLHLCEKTGRELRRNNLAGKTIVVYWRYADFTHGGVRKTFPGYLNDSFRFYELGKNRISNFKFPKAVRLLGVHVSNLVKDYQQLPLFIKDRQQKQLLPYLDEINDRYGELTIKPAFLLKLNRLRNKVGGFRLQD